MSFIQSIQATVNQSNESKEEEKLLVERMKYSVLPEKIKNVKMKNTRSGRSRNIYTIEALQEAYDNFKKDLKRFGVEMWIIPWNNFSRIWRNWVLKYESGICRFHVNGKDLRFQNAVKMPFKVTLLVLVHEIAIRIEFLATERRFLLNMISEVKILIASRYGTEADGIIVSSWKMFVKER